MNPSCFLFLHSFHKLLCPKRENGEINSPLLLWCVEGRERKEKEKDFFRKEKNFFLSSEKGNKFSN